MIVLITILNYSKRTHSMDLCPATLSRKLLTDRSNQFGVRRQDIVDSALLETYHVRAAQ